MNKHFWISWLMAGALVADVPFSIYAQSLDLISTVDSEQGPTAGGGGDSWGPVISADGRYVLFASTANNLTLTTNNTAIPGSIPAMLNVFLRDRTSKTTRLVSVTSAGRAAAMAILCPSQFAQTANMLYSRAARAT